MSTNNSKNTDTSDEIDLGQLFSLFRRGFNRLFVGILKVFGFIKSNIALLVGLGVFGIALGLLLKTLVSQGKRLDVIVSPTLENKTYVYDVIDEVKNSLKVKDEVFFKDLGLEEINLGEMDIEISPLRKTSPENDQVIEVLKEFNNSEAISEILRKELEERSTVDQRITFLFKKEKEGVMFAEKIVDYINSNSFYSELQQTSSENARTRINRNDTLIRQIDVLIENYTQKMLRDGERSDGRLILENEEPLNIPSLLELKNQLIRDIESKKLELIKSQSPVLVKNFGKPYQFSSPVIKYGIVWFPLIFIGAFLIVQVVQYLNRKVKEIE